MNVTKLLEMESVYKIWLYVWCDQFVKLHKAVTLTYIFFWYILYFNTKFYKIDCTSMPTIRKWNLKNYTLHNIKKHKISSNKSNERCAKPLQRKSQRRPKWKETYAMFMDWKTTLFNCHLSPNWYIYFYIITAKPQETFVCVWELTNCF